MDIRIWDKRTRLLHLGLSVTVTFQLFISLFMDLPKPEHVGSNGELLAFEFHEYAGMTAFAIVLLHWLWSAFHNGGEELRHLFPWNRQGRAEIGSEIRGLSQGKLPEGGPRGGLAGLVHGLGFLAVTGMVVTGATIFLLLPESGAVTPFTHFIMEIHETIAILVWVYWCGHLGMTVLHQLRGNPVLAGIFKLGD